jgi:AcrR family transcriptional regulator
MAELERIWAIVSAHREGLSVRDIARHVGLGPTRVHQLVTSPQADSVEHAQSVLREVGWPAPEDSRPAAEEQVADRLIEEAAALVSCVEWLESLSTQETPVVNLRPEDDYPETDYVAVDQSRVIRVLRRIAHDLEELARARRVADMSSSGNDADPRMRLRRRLAEPPIELSRRGTSILQGRKAWENYEHRLQKAGLPAPLNPYRHLHRSAE